MRKLISVFCLAALLQGCGTDTGNPGATRAPVDNPQTSPATPTEQIGQAMCQRLSTCSSVVPRDCELRVSLAPTGGALGLDPTVYPTLHEAGRGLEAGYLTVDSAEQKTCLDAITALRCDDPLIQLGFDPRRPREFDQVYRLLSASPSCGRMIR